MTSSDSSSSASLLDKPSSSINIKHAVPLVLDLERMNYDIWRELFETHCKGYGLSKHLLPTTDKSPEPTEEWERLDSIVKSWIYSTLSQPLLHMILKKNSSAYGVWNRLELLFRENKHTTSIQLDSEIRNITQGDSSISDYCSRIKTLADLLENLENSVPEINLVSYALNGLSTKYNYIATTIRHRDPLPSFMQMRSMLLIEERQILQDQQRQTTLTPTHSDHDSSPTILATDGNSNSSNQRNYYRGG